MSEWITPEERRRLADLNKKLQVVRDRVAGVATGRHTGFFLAGRGGIGKSWTVERELQRREVAYKLWNSHMTARCLFDRLEAYPEAVHLIEDIEGLTSDRRASGILRSALWGTRRSRDGALERLVTWNARGSSCSFIFAGGIIMTSNRRIADLPELEALKTRISCTHLHVTDEETIALMKSAAEGGYPREKHLLDPEQCKEVVQFIIGEAARINRRLDMRLMTNAFEDRLQADDLDAGCHWQDLVAARVCERPSVLNDVEPAGVREQKKVARLKIAREIAGLEADERLNKWQELTGASRATLYRCLARLGQLDALDTEF